MSGCPCERFPAGGGMSCIVIRRRNGWWVLEDELLTTAGLPLRENCLSDPTPEQEAVLDQRGDAFHSDS